MMSPLICFDIVEWHRLERVLQQFDLQQRIPSSCSIEQDLLFMVGEDDICMIEGHSMHGILPYLLVI